MVICQHALPQQGQHTKMYLISFYQIRLMPLVLPNGCMDLDLCPYANQANQCFFNSYKEIKRRIVDDISSKVPLPITHLNQCSKGCLN